jgi:LacI family transcriptional regulator
MVQGERTARSATIIDVAEAAGVSAMTVSRFLRGDRVKAAERIEAAVERLAFRPSEAARSLRSGRTMAIALVVPDITNPYFAAVVRGVESVARDAGFTVVLANSDEDRARERVALDALLGRVDGVILAPVDEEDSNGDAVTAAGLGLVHLDRHTLKGEALDSVLVDNANGAAAAVEHLVGLGHRRIATIAGPSASTPGRERLEGYLRALRDAGIEVPDAYVARSDFKEAGGRVAMGQLWGLSPRPTAVFIANNQMTLGALGWLREEGVAIPETLSVIGFDDHAFAELLDPPLTVVDRPMEEQGAEAMRLLLDQLDGGVLETPRRIVLPTNLVERSSCAPPSEEP